MTYLVVIDTNVLVSALLSKHPDASTVQVVNGLFTEQLHTGVKLPDSKDLVFYEVVMAKQDENARLVTGNMKHFPEEPFIVTPNELLKIIK